MTEPSCWFVNKPSGINDKNLADYLATGIWQSPNTEKFRGDLAAMVHSPIFGSVRCTSTARSAHANRPPVSRPPYSAVRCRRVPSIRPADNYVHGLPWSHGGRVMESVVMTA